LLDSPFDTPEFDFKVVKALCMGQRLGVAAVSLNRMKPTEISK